MPLTENFEKCPTPEICPEVGLSGEFRMQMYRGLKQRKLHDEFSSDPGDYGRGEYWAATEEFASTYGDTILSQIVHLKNALRLGSSEVGTLARSNGLTVMEDGHEKRLAAAELFTADMKAKGFDGIVVEGYEMPGLWSACAFFLNSNEEKQ
jgi:hypothetical protein